MPFFFMMAKVKAPKDEEVTLKCSECGEETGHAYLCQERGIILCPNCQEDFPMHRCPHTHGEHAHILFPGKGDKNIDFLDIVLKISNGNRIKKD